MTPKSIFLKYRKQTGLVKGMHYYYILEKAINEAWTEGRVALAAEIKKRNKAVRSKKEAR